MTRATMPWLGAPAPRVGGNLSLLPSLPPPAGLLVSLHQGLRLGCLSEALSRLNETL